MSISLHDLVDTTTLDCTAGDGQPDIATFRNAIKSGSERLEQLFHDGTPAEKLVHSRAGMIDEILQHAWYCFVDSKLADIALVAVGGYGRGELHPKSDIDLLILLDNDCGEQHNDTIGSFLTFLWDIGLEIGQSVRSLDECVSEGREDITVATNLMEARLLAGPEKLFTSMKTLVGPDYIWPGEQFFEAKWEEQKKRHQKFHDTAHNLEPNIKEGPGGLRDIQVIGWVVKRHFGADELHELVAHDFLTENEYETLIEGQNYLWAIRFALHVLTGRREDRLLFDYQNDLAKMFGYVDRDNTLGVEQFMQSYYRTVMELHRLNEMLLQLFQEAILYSNYSINSRFQVRMGFLEVTNERVFSNYPFALLEIFLILEQHPDLKGVRASTIRLIRDNTHLIDEAFRNDIRAKSLFMEIIRQPHGVTHELRRMNLYGVLAAYLPEFGKLVGRMQYDLFHAYTIDEHILFVVRNLRRLTVPEFTHELPDCSEIIQRIPKPELLYLAGLFHDIGKGRGGDHSVIGEDITREFCQRHQLSDYDTDLVCWLVRHHLDMSSVINKQDVSDADVINSFARLVKTGTRLDYLYLLTVADIRGTNPKLWSSWKHSLLKELYTSTHRAIKRGLDRPLDDIELIQETRNKAMSMLEDKDIDRENIDALWDSAGADYFLYHTPAEIAWHTGAIMHSMPEDLPLVELFTEEEKGSTAVLIYGPFDDRHFSMTTTALEQLSLTVVDARIINLESGYSLDTFRIIEESNEQISEPSRLDEIQQTLSQQLKFSEDSHLGPVSRRTPRALRHFSIQTRVTFHDDEENNRTVVNVFTSDRPGVLSRIARVFNENDIRLQIARINTIGPRIEDVFYVTTTANLPVIDKDLRESIRQGIIDQLKD